MACSRASTTTRLRSGSLFLRLVSRSSVSSGGAADCAGRAVEKRALTCVQISPVACQITAAVAMVTVDGSPSPGGVHRARCSGRQSAQGVR